MLKIQETTPFTNYVDLSNHGLDQLGTSASDLWVPDPNDLTVGVSHAETIVSNYKNNPNNRSTIGIRNASGDLVSLEVTVIRSCAEGAFDDLLRLAVDEPSVLVIDSSGKPAVGMMSVGFDAHGENRIDGSIRVIPLTAIRPLQRDMTLNPDDLAPLAGAVMLERKGVGGHDRPVAQDPEHRVTQVAATVLNRPDIVAKHKSHIVREQSSVATGISNGSLGDIGCFGDVIEIRRGDQSVVLLPDAWIGSGHLGAEINGSSTALVGFAVRSALNRLGPDEYKRRQDTFTKLTPQYAPQGIV